LSRKSVVPKATRDLVQCLSFIESSTRPKAGCNRKKYTTTTRLSEIVIRKWMAVTACDLIES
jgi:hypothetical protein